MTQINFRGTVEKVSTFASKGGGLDLKVQTPHDSSIGSELLENVQRPATITIVFDDQVESDDPDQQPLIEE